MSASNSIRLLCPHVVIVEVKDEAVNDTHDSARVHFQERVRCEDISRCKIWVVVFKVFSHLRLVLEQSNGKKEAILISTKCSQQMWPGLIDKIFLVKVIILT